MGCADDAYCDDDEEDMKSSYFLALASETSCVHPVAAVDRQRKRADSEYKG